MSLLIFLLSFQIYAMPDDPAMLDLKAQPCATPVAVSTKKPAEICDPRDNTPKDILEVTKKDKARMERELAMFKLIDEKHKFESASPACLSVIECTKSIKSVNEDIKEQETTIHRYGPGLKNAIKELKTIEGRLGKLSASQNKKLTPLTLDLLQQSAKYFHDNGADPLLTEGTDPNAHPEAVKAAHRLLTELSQKPFNMNKYEVGIAKDRDHIKRLQAQLTAHKANKYKTAKDFSDEEAKWGKYLDAHAPPGGFPNCGLTIAERAAIYWYTSMGSSVINPELWNKKQAEWAPFLEVMDSGLKKLRLVEGSVYRGAKEMPANVLKVYEPDQPAFDSLAYTSSSADKDNAFNGKYRFEIRNKTGRFIAPFSAYPKELEVLIPAGVKFKVQNKDGTKYVLDEI